MTKELILSIIAIVLTIGNAISIIVHTHEMNKIKGVLTTMILVDVGVIKMKDEDKQDFINKLINELDTDGDCDDE